MVPARRKILPPGNRIACGTNEPLFGFMGSTAMCGVATAGLLLPAALFIFSARLSAVVEQILSGGMVRSANDPMTKTPDGKKGGADGNRTGKVVGDALREAYDEAIGEAIPAEMLELLKQLD